MALSASQKTRIAVGGSGRAYGTITAKAFTADAVWTTQTPDTTSWSDQTADTTIWTDQTPDSSVWTDQ